MVSKVSPLAWNAPIVDDKGNPTPYFVRQLEQLLAEKAVTDALASAAVPQSRLISAGTGLTGGGDLTADRTITLDTTAEAERIRDVIGAALVAGTNITITVNDPGDTITIASTGGSGGAMTLIGEQVLAADGTFADFTSIPATYRDLILVIRGRGSAAAVEIIPQIRFNNDSTANYWFANHVLINGIVVTSQNSTAANSVNVAAMAGNSAATGSSSYSEVIIGDYRSTVFHKNIKNSSGDAKAYSTGNIGAWMGHGIWTNTAAINRIGCITSFKAGSIVSLYGRM